MVLRGIGRLDMGLAVVGGIGIVVLAIILDRLTQSLAQSERERDGKRMVERGPIGLVRRLMARSQTQTRQGSESQNPAPALSEQRG